MVSDSRNLSERPDSSSLPVIKRLLQLAWRYKGGCIAILLLNAAAIALTVGGLKALGIGIDYLRSLGSPDAPPVGWLFGVPPPESWGPEFTIVVIAGSVLGLALLSAVTTFVAAVTAAHVMQRGVVVDLRTAIFGKLQRLSFRFFDANESGSIINRVTSDVQHTRMFLDQVVVQGVTVVLSLVIYLVFMLELHPMLTLACLVSTPAMYVLASRFGRAVKPQYRESRKLADDLVRCLTEHVQGVHVVKGFAREPEQAAAFAEANARLRDKRLGVFKQVARFTPSVESLNHVNLVVLLGFGGWLTLNGQLGLGDGLIVFAGLLNQFANHVGTIANITNTVQNSVTGATRVFEVLDAEVEITDRPDAQPRAVIEGDVRFEHVDFAYRDGDPVLRDVSLHAAPGSCIAIVGATGAGKSSLLSLIPRFYDPQGGRVMIDGIDVRELRVADVRKKIGMVFQESFLFSTSVAANIAFGHPSATREQIEQAARIAAAHDFISALPKGYDTVIGERGADLSGGQRQRLAIARAILMDPAILLLDDATAAIDPETEGEIMSAMDNAMQGRTTFIVAHRLGTLRRADRIIVLDQGQVVAAGTHEELMADGGLYAVAADLQSAHDESKRLLKVGGKS